MTSTETTLEAPAEKIPVEKIRRSLSFTHLSDLSPSSASPGKAEVHLVVTLLPTPRCASAPGAPTLRPLPFDPTLDAMEPLVLELSLVAAAQMPPPPKILPHDAGCSVRVEPFALPHTTAMRPHAARHRRSKTLGVCPIARGLSTRTSPLGAARDLLGIMRPLHALSAIRVAERVA
jgi:hypothetical protein